MPHFEKLTKNLYQGSYPEAREQSIHYDLIINVSDCVCNSLDSHPTSKLLWFPVFEVGVWDYSPFYGSKRAIDKFVNDNPDASILIHCSAGSYQSVIVATAYLLSINHPKGKEMETDMIWKLFKKNGQCPIELEKFMQVMNKFPTYSICGILQECKLILPNLAKNRFTLEKENYSVNNIFDHVEIA